MIICWDNLEKLQYVGDGVWKKKVLYKSGYGYRYYIYRESCKHCKEPFLYIRNSKGEHCSKSCVNKDRKHSKEIIEKIRNGNKGKKWSKDKTKHPNYKGGVTEKNIPLYDTYAHRISYAEEVRRNEKDKNILEVKCAYCGKWFIPTRINIESRIQALNGNKNGEHRFYCSTECKKECPIYKKQKYSAEETNTKQYSREVQPELRQLVFARDNYTCKKCGNTKSLHCHHIEGIRWEPLESVDIDKCITLCKKCHKKVHKKEGCGYNEMRCE